jgi:hypothetical protein
MAAERGSGPVFGSGEAWPPEGSAAQSEPQAAPPGWESIAEWTGGLAPATIPELRDVRPLEGVYALLHALVGRSIRDFLVRAAALKALVECGRAWLSARDIDEVLGWLDEAARDSTLRVLRQSGWLSHHPETGTTLTDAGRWAYDVLAFLHKRLGESELLPTVAGIDYALEIGVDPIWHLQSLRARLVALREEIEAARASHSEVVLRRAAAKVDEAVQLSAQIRTVLDRVSPEHRAARPIVREIHDLLSRLHGGGADLHAAVTEVGRQYLHLTGGLTVEQIVRALMTMTRNELGEAGRDALLPALRPPPLLTPEVLAAAAEQQILRERVKPEAVVFIEPPEPERGLETGGLPPEVEALLVDLATVAAGRRGVPLHEFVPRRDAGESFLRASLLPLIGDQRGGEGAAGQLGALSLYVRVDGDGSVEGLEGQPLSALTPGSLRPLGAEAPDG